MKDDEKRGGNERDERIQELLDGIGGKSTPLGTLLFQSLHDLADLRGYLKSTLRQLAEVRSKLEERDVDDVLAEINDLVEKSISQEQIEFLELMNDLMKSDEEDAAAGAV